MSIRIGAACVLKLSMVLPECKVIETRRFLDVSTQWYEIAKKCIAEKKFLIVTLCIDKNGKLEYLPSEPHWLNFVESSVLQLQSIGANKYNCRIDIINEPMKFISKERYASFINLAYNQVNKRLPVGAGCEEPLTAQGKGDMIPYILKNSQFEYLIIHIQGSCDTEQKTVYWLETYRNYAATYKKKLDCNEANLKDPCTAGGFSLLKAQLRQAELAGIPNFPIVFENLDTSAFSGVEKRVIDYFKTLSFCVNGTARCSKNYNEWINLTEAKKPIPNIVEPIIESEEDMKLKVLQIGSKGNQVKWLQQILEMEYEFENPGGYDGIFGSLTDKQIKDYQFANGETVDGKVGKDTTTALITRAGGHYTPEYWKTKLQIYMAYE